MTTIVIFGILSVVFLLLLALSLASAAARADRMAEQMRIAELEARHGR